MPTLRVVVTSQPRGGKTTLCRKVLERLRQGHLGLDLDGFLSCEVRDSDRTLLGYQLYSIDGNLCETIASSEGPQSGVTVSKYNIYVDAIERVTLPVLERALDGHGPRIFFLDDIGAMTCKSTAFAARARALLETCDPELSVLAAAGWAGSGLAAECRRLPGVTSIVLDEENRDSLPESLAARLEAAATSELRAPPENGADAGDDGSEEDDEGDLSSFDAWGADARCLGVKRGFYDSRSQPPAARATSSGVAKTKAVDEVPSQHSSAETQSLPAVDTKPAPSGDAAWGGWGRGWWSAQEQANACGGSAAAWAWPDAKARAADVPDSSSAGNRAEPMHDSPTDSVGKAWGAAGWRGGSWTPTNGWASNGWHLDSWRNQGSSQGERDGADGPTSTGRWSTGARGSHTWDSGSGWAANGTSSWWWGRAAAAGDAAAGGADLKGGAPERVNGGGSRWGDSSWGWEAAREGG